MTTQTEALKLALEALEDISSFQNHTSENSSDADKAITAIKEALAQSEQEPVAWLYEDTSGVGYRALEWRQETIGYRGVWKKTPLYTHPPVPTAQPEQDGWKMAAEYWYKEFRVAKHGEDQRNYEVRGSLDSWFEHFINPEASIKE